MLISSAPYTHNMTKASVQLFVWRFGPDRHAIRGTRRCLMKVLQLTDKVSEKGRQVHKIVSCTGYGDHLFFFPAAFWTAKAMNWFPENPRRVGRPGYTWDSMTQHFCRHKQIGNWRERAQNLMNVNCKFNLLCLPAPWKGCLLWHAGLTHTHPHWFQLRQLYPVESSLSTNVHLIFCLVESHVVPPGVSPPEWILHIADSAIWTGHYHGVTSPTTIEMTVTVLLFDASAKRAMEVETRRPCVPPINEFVSADGTLVVATDPCRAETHMRCIEAMGVNYGLRISWKKCEVLLIGCEAYIPAPDRNLPTCKASISYLGNYLDASGAGGPKSCRRLRETKNQFDKLAKAWWHSTLYTQQRIRIFQACVVSRLLYCLHTMWPNKAELRKIDGFQAKCLRSILRVPPPYIGRISIATVLQRSRCKHLSTILKSRLLFLFQSIAVLPDEDVRRGCIF